MTSSPDTWFPYRYGSGRLIVPPIQGRCRFLPVDWSLTKSLLSSSVILQPALFMVSLEYSWAPWPIMNSRESLHGSSVAKLKLSSSSFFPLSFSACQSLSDDTVVWSCEITSQWLVIIIGQPKQKTCSMECFLFTSLLILRNICRHVSCYAS